VAPFRFGVDFAGGGLHFGGSALGNLLVPVGGVGRESTKDEEDVIVPIYDGARGSVWWGALAAEMEGKEAS
jgi:hypothetical protein